MSLENPEPLAHVAQPIQADPAPLLDDTGASSTVTRAATPEELVALEALFSQSGRERESAFVAGLFGAWNAGMLARDLLQDYLADEEDEVEPEKKPKKGNRE
ncbi:MAG: hypothetical protein L0Z62_45820 [Gemmataceae bacterium]|nr:hypothetical protein [Gemmataceae bacterium]